MPDYPPFITNTITKKLPKMEELPINWERLTKGPFRDKEPLGSVAFGNSARDSAHLRGSSNGLFI